jgi:NAD(P)-dependent dehydrogenase (short-subunit alcohol dehydrogenase family)
MEKRMTKRLENKVAIVTGANSGIGLATAKLFAAEGAHVYITGRRKEHLEAAAFEIGGNVTAVIADSTKMEDLERLFAQVKTDHGRVDAIVVNAGGGSVLPLGQITEEQVDDTFGRNVKAVIFTVQKALPLLSKGSSVVLIGSTTSIEGTEAFSVYSASKAAVRNLARSWALDLKGKGVRVNVLSRGPTRTPGLVELVGDDKNAQQGFLDALASTIPLGRVGEPEEIAKAALFLASDDSSFVNGVELFADGGKAQV